MNSIRARALRNWHRNGDFGWRLSPNVPAGLAFHERYKGTHNATGASVGVHARARATVVRVGDAEATTSAQTPHSTERKRGESAPTATESILCVGLLATLWLGTKRQELVGISLVVL